MNKQREAVVLNVLEAWAKADIEGMLELFSPEGVYDNVPDQKPMRGRGEIGAWLNRVFSHCWVEAELLHIATSGDWVLSERIDVHVFGDARRALPVMNAAKVVGGKIDCWRDYYCRKTVEAWVR